MSNATLEDRIRALELERDELAHSLEETQRAQRGAQAALRTREQMFAAVVHDLRNPLGTIVMGATALLDLDAFDPAARRVRTVAERIHRQAERMTLQINHLADFAELQAGRLVLDRALRSPSAIIAAAAELVAPLARERGLGFETQASAELPTVECDAERVTTALVNLASAAIKVTPRGGALEIGARGGPTPSVFYVRDPGPAPAPDPNDPDASLAIAIARGIVAAHGGRMWAEHAPGAGNTIWFSLAPG